LSSLARLGSAMLFPSTNVVLSDLGKKHSEVQPTKRRISFARRRDPSLVARRSELCVIDSFRVTPDTEGVF
jgi:hypothetical protein